MKSTRRFLLILGALFVGGLLAAAGLWYVAIGDTSAAFAALVETPTPAPTATPKPKKEMRNNARAIRAQRQATKAAIKQLRQSQKRMIRPRALGTIAALNGNELSVQPLPRDPRNFTLDAITKIIVVGKPNAAASDIHTGDKILVLDDTGDPNRAPRAILVTPADYARDNIVAGKIIAASPTALELRSRGAPLHVTVNDATQIFGDGLQSLTTNDLQIMRRIIVIGTKNAEGTLEAQVIFMPPENE